MCCLEQLVNAVPDLRLWTDNLAFHEVETP
jgi:hypothetical protein